MIGRNGLIIVVAVLGAALALYFATNGPRAPVQSGGAPIVSVTVPTLTGAALAGEAAFNARCASCHGTNAAGQDGVAPPLVHPLYEPGHHGDQAFLIAAQVGVRSHHWQFGDMPPVEGVTAEELQVIVAYVRALQRANGVE